MVRTKPSSRSLSSTAPKVFLGSKKRRSGEETKINLRSKVRKTQSKTKMIAQNDHKRQRNSSQGEQHLLAELDEEENEKAKTKTKQKKKTSTRKSIRNQKIQKHSKKPKSISNDESDNLSIEESDNDKRKRKGRSKKKLIEESSGNEDEMEEDDKEEEGKIKKIGKKRKMPSQEKLSKTKQTKTLKTKRKYSKEEDEKPKKGKHKKQVSDKMSVDEEEEEEEENIKKTKKSKFVSKKNKNQSKTKTQSKKKKDEEQSESESEKEKTKTKFKNKDRSSFLIKSLPEDTYIKSKTSTLITDCCIQCNEKNIFRAINLNDKKLLEKCLKATNEISRVNSSNSLADFKTPLQYALNHNTKELVSTLLEYFKQKHSRVLLPPSKLNLESTGRTVLYSSSNKFNLSRGNRLGNNAFFDNDERDLTMPGRFQTNINSIKTIFFHDDTVFNNFKSFTKLITLDDNEINDLINENIDKGNIDIVSFLMKSLKSIELFGFNRLHVEVTQGKKNLEIKNKQSVNKISQLRITPVHFACINPDSYFLEKLLNKGGEKEYQNINGKKPISYAAVCKGTGPLKLLIENKCNVNDREKNGFTPILYAAREGRYENVKLLIENGANIAHKARPGSCMAIHFACIKGYLNIVKYILEKEPTLINATGAEKKSCLHFAVIHGHEEIVEYLVKGGANINSKDKFKRTPLLLACRFGYSRILNYLIQIGAKQNLSDSSLNSPMHYACGFGHMECVKLLIDSKVNISEVNMWKSSPIEIALLKNHFGVVKYILNNGNYDLNNKFSNGKNILLHILSSIGPGSNDELTYILKEKNTNPNISDDSKMNGFHFLSSFTYRSYLINFLTKEDKDKLTEELHKKHREEYKIIMHKYVVALINAGCDPNGLNMLQQLPIISALEKQNFELAIELLEYTNEITLLDVNELSIFDFCAKNGRILIDECIDFIEALLEKKKINADFLNKETRYGKSALLTICEDFGKNIYNRFYYLSKIEALPLIKKKKKQQQQNVPQKSAIMRPRKAHITTKSFESMQPNSKTTSQIREKTLKTMTTFLKDKFYPMISKLISYGANPNQKSGKKNFQNINKYKSEYFNNYGNVTPLMYLITFPIPELISSFINNNKIDINSKDNLGKTVLFYLIQSGKQIKNISSGNFDETFDIIIDSKDIDLTAVDQNNNSAFLLCIIEQFKEEALKIYQRNTSIDINQLNKDKIHPLLYYMSQGKFNRLLVQFIISNFPINVNCKDEKMRTALHHSAINNNSSQEIDYTLWKLLFDKKGDINAEDCYYRTPLFYLFVDKKEDPIVILSYLLENEGKSIQINQQDIFGNSVLFYAIEAKATFCISTLITKGADPKLINKEGNSACGYSIINESTSITEIYAKIHEPSEFEREMHAINRKFNFISKEEKKEKKIETLENFFDNNNIKSKRATNNFANRRNTFGMDINQFEEDYETDCRLENLFGDENQDNDSLNEYQRNQNRLNMNRDTYENWIPSNNYAEEAENDLFDQKNMEDEEDNEKNSDNNDEENENDEVDENEMEVDDDNTNKKIEKRYNIWFSLSAVTDKYAFNYDYNYQSELNQLISNNYGNSLYEKGNSVLITKNKTQYKDEEKENEEDENEDENEDEEDEEAGNNKNKGNEIDNNMTNKNDKAVTISSNKVNYNLSSLSEKQKISLFRYCLDLNRQVLVFYMINQGFSIFKAIEESLKSGKITFTLTLVSSFANPLVLKQKNSLNQNLLHILASSNCFSATKEQIELLYTQFASLLNISEVDNDHNTPLHFACEKKNSLLIKLLTNDLTDISQLNKTNKKNETSIDLIYKNFALQSQLEIIVQVTYATKQGNINDITKDLSKSYEKMFLRDFDNTKLKRNMQSSERLFNLIALYQILTNNGIDLMSKDSDGNDSLSYCAINGNSNLLFDVFLQENNIKYDAQNKKGQTLIHLIVSPHECGSYQDKDFLEKALKKGFKSTIKDNNNKLPIDYAIEFQYTLLENVLRKYSSPSSIQTSKMDIDDEENTRFEYNFMEDADAYYNEVILPLIEKKKELDFSVTGVDYYCQIRRDNYKICADSTGHLYNVDLVKVERKKWYGGGLFLFYKMQLLLNIKKKMYILVTRWGIIGEKGQFQRTPFGTLEDAEKEFKTIFKSKTGNPWEKLVNNEFSFLHGKYNYQKSKKIEDISDYVRTEAKKIELKKQTQINKDIFDWFKKLIANPFSEQLKYIGQSSKRVNYYSSTAAFFPNANNNETIQQVYFEKDTLSKAFKYLDQMILLVNKRVENNKKMNKINISEKNLSDEKSNFNQLHQENVENLYKLINLSELYYQLIPMSDKYSFYQPISNEKSLNNEINRCMSFTYSEKSLKLFLGSIRNIQSIHPVDYVFRSLKTNITPMALENKGEIGMILNQIAITSENQVVKITNIFKIHSKEKDDNFDKDKLGNRVLLFHGTKAMNLVGILAQGLLIAPVSAIQTGSSYGMGIYFTDFFSKAIQYSEANFLEKGYIFICDVALGNVCKLNQKKQFKSEEALIDQGYNSMISYAVNHMNFDKKYYLNDGSALLTNLVTEKINPINYNKPRDYRMDQHAEYVVYNSNQAKVKYIIEVEQIGNTTGFY